MGPFRYMTGAHRRFYSSPLSIRYRAFRGDSFADGHAPVRFSHLLLDSSTAGARAAVVASKGHTHGNVVDRTSILFAEANEKQAAPPGAPPAAGHPFQPGC